MTKHDHPFYAFYTLFCVLATMLPSAIFISRDLNHRPTIRDLHCSAFVAPAPHGCKP